ncbi:hypothetical protein Misp01_52560 [Microtetraspora sp. NBRC 13810]|uniref:GNAT family N-acetyltransferase n=1 Tax=Microtetraspora sp. NBRC 13810 TaxID=3030990 RepID=UPI00255486C0|nr:GNAT family N-acetyltransferase [Microtetraspora sp. NBRC 13810]GLW10127.1 hypothetical protein Misp01_52560 [Microtetraspora sp. NBRC 13810]
MEEGGIGPDTYAYVVIRDGERVVAILPTCTYRAMRLDQIAGDTPEWLLAPIRTLFPALLRLHVTFCGNLIGEGRLLAEPGAESAAAAAVSAVMSHARQEGTRCVIFKDFADTGLDDLRPALREHGFFDVAGLPDAIITLTCSSFEEYLAGLPAKPRRNARHKIRKFAAHPNLRLAVTTDFGHLTDQMLPLYQHVLDRADHRLDVWTARLLADLAAAPDTVTVTCHDGDRLAGFLLCMITDAELVALRVGLDYAAAPNAFVYHNLHYRAIELAISRGCASVNLTQTHYTPKLEMGARLVSRTHAVAHLNPLARAILRRFLPSALRDPSIPAEPEKGRS